MQSIIEAGLSAFERSVNAEFSKLTFSELSDLTKESGTESAKMTLRMFESFEQTKKAEQEAKAMALVEIDENDLDSARALRAEITEIRAQVVTQRAACEAELVLQAMHQCLNTVRQALRPKATAEPKVARRKVDKQAIDWPTICPGNWADAPLTDEVETRSSASSGSCHETTESTRLSEAEWQEAKAKRARNRQSAKAREQKVAIAKANASEEIIIEFNAAACKARGIIPSKLSPEDKKRTSAQWFLFKDTPHQANPGEPTLPSAGHIIYPAEFDDFAHETDDYGNPLGWQVTDINGVPSNGKTSLPADKRHYQTMEKLMPAIDEVNKCKILHYWSTHENRWIHAAVPVDGRNKGVRFEISNSELRAMLTPKQLKNESVAVKKNVTRIPAY